ncbi:class I SAM-dependent methyltransferase [Kitasatospora sp. NPDC089797]|uniref:class I SAM-dependent methyltransferase n=1 Tax=Kitasatospora sp. NPDC089797 TaxID=3155298 RepID=UPI00341B9BDC
MTDSRRAIGEYWDAAAACFDDEPDHGLRAAETREAWARRVRKWLPAGSAEVLDVGCGTGSLAELVAADGHRVTGVDLAPRMVARARAKLAAAGLTGRFLVGDAGAPPVREGGFDVLLCRHLLWTLPEPERSLGAWVRLLRPGGRLVLVEGRWGGADERAAPYVVGAGRLPWGGGVSAEQLAAAVGPLVTRLRIEPLSGAAELWGGPVTDERYALVADR